MGWVEEDQARSKRSYRVFCITMLLISFFFGGIPILALIVDKKERVERNYTYEKFTVDQIGACTGNSCRVKASSDKSIIYLTLDGPRIVGESFSGMCYYKDAKKFCNYNGAWVQ